MSLEEKTNRIKSLCNRTKINFIDIGKLLVEIRDKELWKESYKSFTEYLVSEDFEFKRRMAYKLIDVYTQFGKNVQLLHKLGIGKLIELTYIPDKEAREELTQKTIKEDLTGQEIREEVKQIKEEDLFKQIHRKAQREDQDTVKDDEPMFKCKRQARSILTDIDHLRKPIDDMKLRLEKWLKFSNKFKEDEEMQTLKAAIFLKWKELK